VDLLDVCIARDVAKVIEQLLTWANGSIRGLRVSQGPSFFWRRERDVQPIGMSALLELSRTGNLSGLRKLAMDVDVIEYWKLFDDDTSPAHYEYDHAGDGQEMAGSCSKPEHLFISIHFSAVEMGERARRALRDGSIFGKSRDKRAAKLLAGDLLRVGGVRCEYTVKFGPVYKSYALRLAGEAFIRRVEKHIQVGIRRAGTKGRKGRGWKRIESKEEMGL
jgi:hypothetical protein